MFRNGVANDLHRLRNFPLSQYEFHQLRRVRKNLFQKFLNAFFNCFHIFYTKALTLNRANNCIRLRCAIFALWHSVTSCSIFLVVLRVVSRKSSSHFPLFPSLLRDANKYQRKAKRELKMDTKGTLFTSLRKIIYDVTKGDRIFGGF